MYLFKIRGRVSTSKVRLEKWDYRVCKKKFIDAREAIINNYLIIVDLYILQKGLIYY